MNITTAKIFFIYIFVLFPFFVNSTEEVKYPFVYIPGMFDNGDLLTKDNLLVKNLNGEDGYYYRNYFDSKYNYDKYEIQCGSNIVGSKYSRLVVANLIKEIRTNISIFLMAERLYCLIEGKAPKNKSYNLLTKHKGNDYGGFIEKEGKRIFFKGVREEIWIKYGKKVFYTFKNKTYNVSLIETDNFFENKDFYFNTPKEIKFNFVTHSSGGLALREYIRLMLKEGKEVPVKNIINLSVPQKGASMVFNLHKGFRNLINHSVDSFYKNKDLKSITIISNGKELTYSYSELNEMTNVKMLYGDNSTAVLLRSLLSEYILFFIPFDGYNRVLGNDPALYDLHPKHRLLKLLNNTIIPENIKIYNYRVRNAYAPLFKNIGYFLSLGQNDGVVDYNDTSLELIPNYDRLKILEIDVENANHIPLPYIKPLFELRETITKYYSVLGLLLKRSMKKDEAIDTVYALFNAIMTETGLDLKQFLEKENYSVIDHFAENPVSIIDN